jgi:hypothetical protein
MATMVKGNWSPDYASNAVFFFLFLLRLGLNSAYSGYPELWILRYPADRCSAVPLPGFEFMTLWLRVRRPSHSATMLFSFC